MTNTPPTGKGTFALPTAIYDVAKEVAQIYLPALGVLYAALSTLYGWGYVEQVSGTIIAVDTFLGVVLKISNVSFNNSSKSVDGILTVDQSDPTTDKVAAEFSTPLNDVYAAQKVTLAVNDVTPVPTTPSALGSMDPRNVTDLPSSQ